MKRYKRAPAAPAQVQPSSNLNLSRSSCSWRILMTWKIDMRFQWLQAGLQDKESLLACVTNTKLGFPDLSQTWVQMQFYWFEMIICFAAIILFLLDNNSNSFSLQNRHGQQQSQGCKSTFSRYRWRSFSPFWLQHIRDRCKERIFRCKGRCFKLLSFNL